MQPLILPASILRACCQAAQPDGEGPSILFAAGDVLIGACRTLILASRLAFPVDKAEPFHLPAEEANKIVEKTKASVEASELSGGDIALSTTYRGKPLQEIGAPKFTTDPRPACASVYPGSHLWFALRAELLRRLATASFELNSDPLVLFGVPLPGEGDDGEQMRPSDLVKANLVPLRVIGLGPDDPKSAFSGRGKLLLEGVVAGSVNSGITAPAQETPWILNRWLDEGTPQEQTEIKQESEACATIPTVPKKPATLADLKRMAAALAASHNCAELLEIVEMALDELNQQGLLPPTD
jgi:hypothetical protein